MSVAIASDQQLDVVASSKLEGTFIATCGISACGWLSVSPILDSSGGIGLIVIGRSILTNSSLRWLNVGFAGVFIVSMLIRGLTGVSMLSMSVLGLIGLFVSELSWFGSASFELSFAREV